MSKEIDSFQTVKGELNISTYFGGENGMMLQLTQGLGIVVSIDTPGFIQITKEEALSISTSLLAWVKSSRLYVAQLQVGTKVHYQPDHYPDEHFENGIVKEVRQDVIDSVWVVYNCAGNWDDYRDYTSAMTNLRDLNLGWR